MGYGRLNADPIDRGNLMQYVTPQDLRSFGLIPELVGRLPVLTYMQPLDKAALRSILTEPKNAIVKQYVRLFELDGVELTFDEEVLDYIVDKAVEFKLGARGLRSNLRGDHDGHHVRAAFDRHAEIHRFAALRPEEGREGEHAGAQAGGMTPRGRSGRRDPGRSPDAAPPNGPTRYTELIKR